MWRRLRDRHCETVWGTSVLVNHNFKRITFGTERMNLTHRIHFGKTDATVDVVAARFGTSNWFTFSERTSQVRNGWYKDIVYRIVNLMT